MPFVSILLALGTLFAVFLMGIPLLLLVGGKRRWRAYAKLDTRAVPRSYDAPPAFTPLEMDPFRLRWPSEIQRVTTNIPDPPWPSETWDDEYFGAEARRDVQKMKDMAARIDQTRQEQKEKELKRLENERQRRAQRAAEQKAQQEASEEQFFKKTKRESSRDRELVQYEERRQPERSQPGQTRRNEPRPQADNLPDPQDIARMVRNVGLAGAVDELRGQTGWDFRTAAQHLAKVLRDQK